MLYIGIDSGTQSTKCIVLDLETGQLLASAQRPYDLIKGLPSGHLEQNPSDWTEAVDITLSDCLNQIGDRKHLIKGIGVSGQQHGLVVLGKNNQVIRPAKLWCDTSTTDQCDQFSAAFGNLDGLINKTGNAIVAGYTIPKLLWLKQNEPDHFKQIATVLLPHDYLNFYLTGNKRMEFGDASGTGVLNIRTREWDYDLINFVDPSLAKAFPKLGSSNDIHGILSSDLAQKWGLGSSIVVSAGGGDNMMGAIGTGNVSTGVVTASFGTSGTLYGFSKQPIIDPKGEAAAFCDSTDNWLPLICTMNVTLITEMVRDWFDWSLPQLEDRIRSVPPGADGVSFLPYIHGERTPNLPNGNGVIQGLNSHNASPSHMARAAMEGATFGLAYGLARFNQLGLEPTEIRLTGGGSKSAVWREMSADIFGVPVVGLATTEGPALGGAIQAAHVSGEGTYTELCDRCVKLDETTRCHPDPKNIDLYREKLIKHNNLTTGLVESGML